MTVDIPLTLGLEKGGGGVAINISKAPHVLVAGMTGAGKSVLVHDLICQALGQRNEKQVAFVLVDPKRVEFSAYKGLPHMALPPVYQPEHILYALGWAQSEMTARFDVMERMGWNDVTGVGPWPRLFVVVDELANVVLRGKEYERPLIDIASMGRAAGVHLILATQRPDASVINGLIRANVPTRVALPTFTRAESRIILDMDGAEGLQIPERLVRLPGAHGVKRVVGRNWTRADIDRALRGAQRA